MSIQGAILNALRRGLITQEDATALFQNAGGVTGKLSPRQIEAWNGITAREPGAVKIESREAGSIDAGKSQTKQTFTEGPIPGGSPAPTGGPTATQEGQPMPKWVDPNPGRVLTPEEKARIEKGWMEGMPDKDAPPGGWKPPSQPQLPDTRGQISQADLNALGKGGSPSGQASPIPMGQPQVQPPTTPPPSAPASTGGIFAPDDPLAQFGITPEVRQTLMRMGVPDSIMQNPDALKQYIASHPQIQSQLGPDVVNWAKGAIPSTPQTSSGGVQGPPTNQPPQTTPFGYTPPGGPPSPPGPSGTPPRPGPPGGPPLGLNPFQQSIFGGITAGSTNMRGDIDTALQRGQISPEDAAALQTHATTPGAGGMSPWQQEMFSGITANSTNMSGDIDNALRLGKITPEDAATFQRQAKAGGRHNIPKVDTTDPVEDDLPPPGATPPGGYVPPPGGPPFPVTPPGLPPGLVQNVPPGGFPPGAGPQPTPPPTQGTIDPTIPPSPPGPPFPQQPPPPGTPGTAGGPPSPPIGGPPPPGATPSEGLDEDLFKQLFGLGEIGQIGDVDLGETPQLSGDFSPGFDKSYWGFLGDMQGGIGRNWDEAQYQNLDTAQIDRTGVPQPGAARMKASTPQGFEQLNFLLSGQGFRPDVMSKLRATAIDDISGGGVSRMSQAKRALGQAGMSQSGAAPALQEQIARETTQEQGRALNQIDIGNAERGLENLRMGAGMESGRRALGAQLETTAGMSNMQQANMMALQNASNMLTAMRDNMQAQNTSNLTKFGAETARRQSKAQDQSQALQSGQQQYLGGKISKDIGAESANAANTIGQNLNRAQLKRQKDMFNVGTKENRWGGSMNAAMGLVTGQNPGSYYQGNAGGYQPNMILPKSLLDIAGSIANRQVLGGK
mgnify:FL=1